MHLAPTLKIEPNAGPVWLMGHTLCHVSPKNALKNGARNRNFQLASSLMLPTYASYGSESESDEALADRPLLVKPKRALASLALLSATLVMASGGAIYGTFDQTAVCQETLKASTNIEAFFPHGANASTTATSETTHESRTLIEVASLFNEIDKDGNGDVSLAELLYYLSKTKDDAIAELRAGADAAETARNVRFVQECACVAKAYSMIVPKGASIVSTDQLQRVVAQAHEHCDGRLIFPTEPPVVTMYPPANSVDSETYSRDQIIQFVKGKTTSSHFLQCTIDAMDQFPPAHKFTTHDVDTIMNAVVKCLASWITRCRPRASTSSYG
ncbi:Aste57867_2410 [Aphanomyces stellatus]|uniref:Aste57867_2410 protein n=1 Tax=Aphanomyces stellatus TaxID=120398 RepID=A0A485KD62_9STRA|nr:hypothetical protein As57867_002404 [Aphanomyces stellatus]VFT79611.1 Aste57867_2410 [Aphanomyces stellatus]